jgi:hypothetical protein
MTTTLCAKGPFGPEKLKFFQGFFFVADNPLMGFKRGTTRLWESPEGPGKLPQGKVFLEKK